MDEHPSSPSRPIDERVRDALRDGIAAVDADAGPPRPDPADLTRRARRRNQRRQMAVGIAATIAVVLGGAGGWVAGREGSPRVRAEAATPDAAAPTSTDGVDVVASPQLPAITPSDQGGLEGGEEGISFEPAPRRAPGVNTAYWPGPWPLPPAYEPTARLYRRITDGVTIDVRANRLPEGEDPGWGQDVPFADPPGWCFPSGRLYAGLRTGEAVGQGWGPRYTVLRPGTLHTTGTLVGGPEKEPRWLVLVQVPTDIDLVTARFPGGGSDTMAPVHGVAALTAPVDPSIDLADEYLTDIPPLRLVGTGGDDGDLTYEGSVWGTEWGGAAVDDTSVPPPPDPACSPPTTLPEPGSTQPDDPAGAEAAVRGTWDTIFNLDQADDTVLELVDDPDGVDVALERLRTEGYAPEVIAAASVVLDDVVFADATTAYVRYNVTVEGTGIVFDNRYGEARLVDGTWKVTRATACGVLALGLGACPPKGG